jgi:DNA-binding winged helix-turn-helix (wHTH) protein/TolB-like protein/Tfp pilus assembly protein PilF
MNAIPAAQPRLRIGEWDVDPATNGLSRGGETVRIEPRAMDLLVLLARRCGDVVSRDEMLAAVWPGMVVGDEALTQSVTKLRRALGDDPRSPRYIETLSKRGYRLLAPVGPVRRPARRTWAMVASAVLVLAGTLVLVRWWPAPAPALGDPAAAHSTERMALMVLPFQSVDASGERAYLARGIGDALVADLGRLSGLRVIVATDDKAASRPAMRARYLVSGSVQREADTLRVIAHLIDATTGERLWSERFERPFGDLFAIQDEIIRGLVKSLPAKVSDAERRRLAKRHTRSLEAYDHFLRAQALLLVRGVPENLEARVLYRRAIELDPQFARAYAGLAMTHAMDHRLRGGPRAPSLDRALELAESARLIDPEIAEVHWALGFVHAQDRRHDEAIASLQRAIELNPSFADAYALIGGIHTYRGEPARSIPLLRTAMRLHPDGGHLYFLLLGRAYLFDNDLEQALINLRAALERNPADLESRLYLVAALIAAGDESAARWEAEEVRALEPRFSLAGWLESYPLTSAPHREKLRALVARAGL